MFVFLIKHLLLAYKRFSIISEVFLCVSYFFFRSIWHLSRGGWHMSTLVDRRWEGLLSFHANFYRSKCPLGGGLMSYTHSCYLFYCFHFVLLSFLLWTTLHAMLRDSEWLLKSPLTGSGLVCFMPKLKKCWEKVAVSPLKKISLNPILKSCFCTWAKPLQTYCPHSR